MSIEILASKFLDVMATYSLSVYITQL